MSVPNDPPTIQRLGQRPATPPPPPPVAMPVPMVTGRSVLVGLVCVALVCALTPFNDFVFSDTSLTAGFLPLGAVLIQFVLIVCINAPLHRLAPRAALTSGELAIVALMTLVACGLPNWGLMRYLIPTPVFPFFHGKTDQPFWDTFVKLGLPSSLFVVPNVAEGRGSDVVSWFYASAPQGERIPWPAWARPLFTWGIFAAAMFATLVSLARLILPQWASNERLPFPLVQVQAALIEAPEPGRALNRLFLSRGLWVALAFVMLIHGMTLLHAYQPRHFNAISPGYNFTNLMSEPPLMYLRPRVKMATLSFIIVGATYFIRSRAALSLWGIYLLINLLELQLQVTGRVITAEVWADQHLGACAAFVIGMLWIGRHHWLRVTRAAFGLQADKTYRTSFWVAVTGIAVMFAWLMWAGAQWWVAALVVTFILVAHIIVARVVAETGLPIFRSSIAVRQILFNLPVSAVSARDMYLSGTFTVLGPLTTRDSVLGYAMHGMAIADHVQDGRAAAAQHRRIGWTIALALVVGAAVAAAATLYCHYTWSTPLDRNVVPQGNNFGAVYTPDRDMGDHLVAHASGAYPMQRHSTPVHVGIGFAVVTFLEVMSLRLAAWPLLPIGFVASHGAFIQNAWFSILVGWLLKVLIVRFGGADLYQKARPFFVGLIFGESLMAGLWLIVNAIVVSNGGLGQKVAFML